MLRLFKARCRAVRGLLWDYTEERLSEGPMEMVEKHLHGCAACRREVESLRQAQSLLRAYRQQTPPAPRTGWDALRDQLMAEPSPMSAPAAGLQRHRRAAEERGYIVSGRSDRRSFWQPRFQLAGGMAVALFVTAVGFQMVRANNGLNTPPGPVNAIPHPGDPGSSASHVHSDAAPMQAATTQEAPQGGASRTHANEVDTPDFDIKITQMLSQSAPPRLQTVSAKMTENPERKTAPIRRSKKSDSASQKQQDRLKFVENDPNSNERPQPDSQPRSMGGAQFMQASSTGRYVMGSLEPITHEDEDAVY